MPELRRIAGDERRVYVGIGIAGVAEDIVSVCAGTFA